MNIIKYATTVGAHCGASGVGRMNHVMGPAFTGFGYTIAIGRVLYADNDE
jgi:hypothetical protein